MKAKKNFPFMPYSIFAVLFMASSLIIAFSMGYIIHIPNGTHEGGIISMIGVGVILLAMVAAITAITLLQRNKVM